MKFQDIAENCIIQVQPNAIILDQYYLKIKLCLDFWRDINRIGRGPGRGQGCSGLGQIAKCMVCLALQQLNLHKEMFVIELLELLQQRRSQSQGLLVTFSLEIEADQPRLQGLTQKRSSLIFGPFDTFLKESTITIRKGIKDDLHFLCTLHN